MTAAACPDENTVVEFVEGLLSVEAAARVESHVDACADCRAQVAALARTASPSDAGPGDAHTAAMTPPLDASSLAPGTPLGERFRIVRRLGAGAMGVVYEADDLELGVRVAVKLLHPGAATPDRLRRLRQEIVLARRITHPNVCRVHDVAMAAGVPFITMERVDGEGLDALLARGAPPVATAMRILVQVCDALEAAHRQGVVHRDLKPGNVIVGAGGGVTVMDFGLARAMDSGEPEPRMHAGTPAYWSPEQADARPAGAPADVYALGVLCCELLGAGRPAPGVAPTSPPDAVPARYRPVVERCLKARPEDRFTSAGEVRDALLRADAAPAARITNLPPPATRFIGRERDLKAIDVRLGEGERLVTLLGPPGTGKTRLALRCGERVLRAGAGDRPGGVWFCDLGACRDAATMCTAVGVALGIPLTQEGTSVDAAARQLGHALAARGRVLVIFDNFEQLVRAGRGTVAAWLRAAPDAAFVVTSRERLRLPGEVVHEVGPLSLPDADGGAGATPALESEAVQLFVDRACAAWPGFTARAEDTPVLGRIVARLDGLPLAIELCASRVRTFGTAGLLARLERSFVLLDGARQGADRRHATLRGAIDWSWRLLAPYEQSALAQCAVFRGGFMLEAAEAVVDLSDHAAAPPVADVLESLCNKSLLRAYEAPGRPGEVRLGMYESIREYAATALGAARAGAGDATATQARHAEHFMRASEAWAAAMDTTGGEACLPRLEGERENLLAVYETAAATSPATIESRERALRAVLALDHLLARRGPLAQRLALLDAVLGDGSEDASPHHIARALTSRGEVRRIAGPHQAARADFERALGLARAAGDRRLEGQIALELAMLEMMSARPRETDAEIDRALVHFRALGDPRQQGHARLVSGFARSERGESAAAREDFREAVALLREAGDRRHAARALASLATVEASQGQREQVLARFEEALADVRGLGDRAMELSVLATRATCALVLGRGALAAADCDRALALARELGARQIEGGVLGTYGVVHHVEGRTEVARDLYQRAAALLREIGRPQHEGMWLGFLGAAAAECGRLEEARAALDAAAVRLRAIGDAPRLATVRLLRASLDAARANAAAAAGDARAAARHRRAAARRRAAAQELTPGAHAALHALLAARIAGRVEG